MAAESFKPLLTDILSENSSLVPNYLVRPLNDRPDLHSIETSNASSIPLIDLQDMAGPERSRVVKAITIACQTDGFFQVKNHGIPATVINEMLRVSREFFRLPELERMQFYSDDPMKTARLSTSFNVKTEKVGSWRDYLRLHCHPLEDFIHEWPSVPPSFREVVGEYARNVRELALRILELISESLGLQGNFINKALGNHGQHIAINYYPPCQQPELTYGLPGHKDPNAITILLQDGVSGLQVLKDGKWVAVDSAPEMLVVNLGDQMQVLSNDRYKSVLHRVLVNSSNERISVPTFYCPSPDAVIEPLEALMDNKDHPPNYRSYTYGEYYDKFWDVGLNSESCLAQFKAT